jgi:hypothetical protein
MAGAFDGGFKLDTMIRGNYNTGHEFGDGGIGRKFTSEERRSIVEFLKTDCVVGWASGPRPQGLPPTSCDDLHYSTAP